MVEPTQSDHRPFESKSNRSAIWMGAISLVAVFLLRFTGERSWGFFSEFIVICFCLAISARERGKVGAGNVLAAWPALATPLISRFVRPLFEIGPAWEMVAVTVMGVGSLVLALLSQSARSTSLSIVCSGFLILFVTAISDGAQIVWLAVLWTLICLWWMVARHWSRLDACMAHEVRHDPRIRPASMALGIFVCAIGLGLSMAGPSSVSQLSLQLLPTSGGRKWEDPSALRGVGNGDMLVAAEANATSFGAVETDVFLDSEKPSLFDMFNDSWGEPITKKRTERAVAMSPDQLQESQETPGKSERMGNAMQTARTKSARPQDKPEDRKSTDLLHWIGPTGVRLALQRFDTFDGLQWTSEAKAKRQPLIRRWEDERYWFFRDLDSKSFSTTAVPAAVKFIHLKSNRIPAMATNAGVHIQDITEAEFFGVTPDGCWCMPPREAVPQFTVIRQVVRSVDQESLDDLTEFPKPAAKFAGSRGLLRTQEIVDSLQLDASPGWQQVQQVVEHLRNEFLLDRSIELNPEDPLLDFVEGRRGNDYMFATAAALMLQHLGYRTRIATGFYVDPEDFDYALGQTPVGSEDVHAWVEIAVNERLWLPLEPSPGYLPPTTCLGTWARICRAGAASWPWGLLLAAVGGLGWRLRAPLVDLSSLLAWTLSRWLSDRGRVRLLTQIMDLRFRLAGHPRPVGVPHRHWYAHQWHDPTMQPVIHRVFDAADCLWFSGGQVSGGILTDSTRLVRSMTARRIARQGSHPTLGETS